MVGRVPVSGVFEQPPGSTVVARSVLPAVTWPVAAGYCNELWEFRRTQAEVPMRKPSTTGRPWRDGSFHRSTA
jgi:hypothetical protein